VDGGARFDQIWLTEHHFIDYGLSVDPASLAATAAARTSRCASLAAAILHSTIRCGSRAGGADRHHLEGPPRVGVGGQPPGEFRATRAQQENRERFDEAVDIMLRAWNRGALLHDGRFFTIGETRVIPKPWQRRTRRSTGLRSDDGIESSAARGWPMLNSLLTGRWTARQAARQLSHRAAQARAHRAEIAVLMKDWGVSRQIYVAATDAQALAEAKDAEMWYQDSLRRFQVPERIAGRAPSLQPGFRAAAERFKKVTWEGLVGRPSPSARPTRWPATSRPCATWESATCCWMNFGGLPQDKIRRSMELFARRSCRTSATRSGVATTERSSDRPR